MALPSMISEAPLEYTYQCHDRWSKARPSDIRGEGGGLAKDWIEAHISGVEGLDAVLVTEPELVPAAGSKISY